MSVRVGVLLAAVAALFSAGPLAANAQDYPSRPIKLLIHTPPGSLVWTGHDASACCRRRCYWTWRYCAASDPR